MTWGVQAFRGTVFQEIWPGGVGFKTGDFVQEKLGELPTVERLSSLPCLFLFFSFFLLFYGWRSGVPTSVRREIFFFFFLFFILLETPTAESALYSVRANGQFDMSRQEGRKTAELFFSRRKRQACAYSSGEGREEPAHSDPPGSDLRPGREK